ncbi:MAG: hypothetical protein IH851_05465 [Armatimonadetes bacterium]|nr:hypothetical protein [Armatimonadota bacterium]
MIINRPVREVVDQLTRYLGVWVWASVATMTVLMVLGFALGIVASAFALANYGLEPGDPDYNMRMLYFNLTAGLPNAVAAVLISGGLYRMALAQHRGVAPALSQLFSIRDVFWKLAALGFTWHIFKVLVWALLMRSYGWPGGLLPQLSLTFIIVTLALFTVPLVVDRRIGPIAAIRLSLQVVLRQLFRATWLNIKAGLCSLVGLIACGVGVVITLPLFYLIISRAYLDVFADCEAGEAG